MAGGKRVVWLKFNLLMRERGEGNGDVGVASENKYMIGCPESCAGK